MRFVGQAEVYAALAASPADGDALRAWTSEVKHRIWTSAGELAADFQNVDVSGLPVVVFYVAPTALRIETLINFRLGVVLVTAIQRPAVTLNRFSQTLGARHDH